jgi:hypothetical protein
VILDNLNTHKRNEHWLKKHPKVHFHFTPTSASWFNQVEVWFSILQGQSLSGTSFTSLEQFPAGGGLSSSPRIRLSVVFV